MICLSKVLDGFPFWRSSWVGTLEVLPADAPLWLCCEVCYSLVSRRRKQGSPWRVFLGRIPCRWDPSGAEVRRFHISLACRAASHLPALEEKGQRAHRLLGNQSLVSTMSLLFPLLFSVDIKATKKVACFYTEVSGHEDSLFLYFTQNIEHKCIFLYCIGLLNII